MRECGAVFAGELAGHYYFKENFTAESSALAVIMNWTEFQQNMRIGGLM